MALYTISGVYELIWSEKFWLVPNITWEDMERFNSKSYASDFYLWYPIPMVFIFLLFRTFFVKYISIPLGIKMGLRPGPRKRPPLEKVQVTLEKLYLKRKKIRPIEIREKAAELSMTERQIERWIRQRKLQDKPTTLEKFGETGFRCFYQNLMIIQGIIVLWDKPWLWDSKHLWHQYPFHAVDGEVWWYYMLAMTVYWSLTVSQFTDVKRKDFVELFIHHIATILLLSLSWIVNLTRVGTLILLVHNVSDVLLDSAKLFKYANYQRTCDTLFALFTLSWIATRIGIYPTWIIYSVAVEAPQMLQMFPIYYMFNVLLSLLLVLHVIWTYFIFKAVYKALLCGKTEKDTRSDSNDESLSSIDEDSDESDKLDDKKSQ